ncbi:hypothetical protein [Streptomyces bangladeshensis]|uniref:Tip attachment protein J domain-containing protein n=1 Tax=Streptomyces bangladeshensis TaxID=295352 RepID=A0ABN3BT77_9ACTN
MPGLVSQIAGLRRRLALVPAPARASGEASNGEPVQVEMLVSGTWVDVTGYTLVRDDSGSIQIMSGIRDEGSQTEAGTCTLELDNRDGRFSPRNPSGPYYGAIGRNTPIRISVPDGNGGKSYRIWGEASEWAPNWDTSGSDVWTDLSANGILRRLAQGPAPERSVIYNAITDPPLTGLVAYWPCEDAADSRSVASALTSGSPMTISGTPTLAAYSGFGASDPLPVFTGGSLTGGVTRYDNSAVSQYQVRFLLSVPAAGLADSDTIARVRVSPTVVGEVEYLDIEYNDPPGGVGSFGGPGTISIVPYNSEESMLGYSGEESLTLDVRSRLLRVSIEVSNSGTALSVTLRVLDINTGITDSTTIGLSGTNVTRVASVALAPSTLNQSAGATGMAAGHVTVQTTVTSITDLGAAVQPSGETAGRRMQRLCAGAGIAFDWVGDLDDTVAMGAQSRQNLLAQLQECTLADGGLLYESRSGVGLGYRTRASLYNQDPVLTLDYTAGQLVQIPVPVEDDRYVQNKVTVTVGGASATYEETSGTLRTELPPAGVGEYGQEYTLNLGSSDAGTLKDQAAWRVHLGTVDEARFPQISVNLAHPSITPAMRRAILAMRLGDRIQITNPPAWLPPDTIDQLILGMSETITHFEHKVTFTCAPASPYSSIGVLDTAWSRIDTDGSELVANISSSATSIGVQPSAGADVLWTKDTADFPLDIRVGGEVMRVTAISDLVTDTFTRTASSGWGTSDSGFTWTASGGSATDYSVGSGVGAHLLATAGTSRRCILPTVISDFDFYVTITADQLATGAILTGSLITRYADADNFYSAQLQFTTSNTVLLVVFKRVNAVETTLGTYTMPGTTFVAGTQYRIRFKVQGPSLRAKVWLASDVETPEWQVSVTDGTLTGSQWVGVRSISGAGNTNVNPSIKYDDFQIVSPQTFTLTRSVNGVAKAHSAGADVRLATPTYLAL